ncbi:MAG: carboxypeptidase regulatory-like domain-containing protein [Paludibacteraceae bacterium]|nr:carboxypeptidase regulatory-like domain-containing protein [Paludibacteraceae bacterium]
MRKTLFVLFSLLITLGVMAQENAGPTKLTGRLVIEGSDKAVPNATITLVNQDISTISNLNGEFSFMYLEGGDDELIVEADGFIEAIELVQIHAGETTELGDISMHQNVATDVNEEILLSLNENELTDDEGRSQQQASSASASTDVFNSTISFAWSSARYRNRGYENRYETVYVNGVNFNTAERGNFNFSSMGGLNDASRNREVVNPIGATNFTFGGLGTSTNYLMNASRFAQGWKISLAGTNRNYKAAVRASYASGPLRSGWSFIGQLAYRFSPYIDQKGIIGEGIKYYSLGYFFSAEKIWDNGNRLNITTFGAPTERAQNAAVTQEVYDLTDNIYYNPYWGYQNGRVRNSRIVKSYDPTIVANFDLKINDENQMKFALGYHYSMYSNSALTFYNAPDPRPDYYRNLPSAMWDNQIANAESEQLYNMYGDDADGSHYPWGLFIGNNLNHRPLGNGTVGDDGNIIGPTVDARSYNALVKAWKDRDNKVTQINWDNLYAANYTNNYLYPEGSARYILERRHNDLQEVAATVGYTNTKFDHLKMTAGLEAKFSEGIHYKTIDDLLGGIQWIDVDAFAERDIKDLAVNIGMTQDEIGKVMQNDLADPDRKVKEGDRFGYDYRMNMGNLKFWFQNEWRFNEVDLYYAIQGTFSSMQRSTDMVNGRAWYLSQIPDADASLYFGSDYKEILAKAKNGTLKKGQRYYGKEHDFFDPSFKAGVTYKINGRNHLIVNALAQTQAPLARDAYLSQRVHDRVVDNIYTHDNAKNLKDFYAASQKMVGADLTYSFNYPIIRGRITGFFTQFWDGTELNGYYDDEIRTFVNQAITGINRRHMGIEAAASVKLGTYFTLTGVVNVGDYRYTSNAFSVTSAENGMAMGEKLDLKTNQYYNVYETRDSILLKGMRVATGPQVATSLKLSFFHPKMWFADITLSYYDWNFMNAAPARRYKSLFTGVRADGSKLDGWYGDQYANAIKTTDGGPAIEAADGGYPTNAVLDKNGVPELKYPYNLMSRQESLTATNPLNRFLLDVSVGKLIYLPNRQSLSINLSITNITNNTHFKTGGYQQARLPRATRQKQPDNNNSVITANAWKFPAKYYYAWGTNFYLTVTYKF